MAAPKSSTRSKLRRRDAQKVGPGPAAERHVWSLKGCSLGARVHFAWSAGRLHHPPNAPKTCSNLQRGPWDQIGVLYVTLTLVEEILYPRRDCYLASAPIVQWPVRPVVPNRSFTMAKGS